MDAASENGLAERLNKTIAKMTRRLLYRSRLPPTFWADAVIHAVYLYNRTVHSAINMTPHEAYSGVKPDLSRLRTFGSHVLYKIPGKRAAKLDHHVYKDIFIGYGATDKHIRYIDSVTLKEKVATHAVFDKAYYTATTRSPGPQLLYSIGVPSEEEDRNEKQINSVPTQVKYPPMTTKPLKIPLGAKSRPLPLQEYATKRNVTARTAKIDYLWNQEDVHTILLSSNCFDYAFEIEVIIDHLDDLGFDLVEQEDKPLRINNCRRGTKAAKIPRWRSTVRHRYIDSINETKIF